MKRPFQVGDRVAVYGLDGNCELVRIKTTITGFASSGQLYLDEKDTVRLTVPKYDFSVAHPKQCRRLVKKVRRRIWIEPYVLTSMARSQSEGWKYCGLDSVGIQPNEVYPGAVEFVEVRKGKS
jgi:hypothetical protein